MRKKTQPPPKKNTKNAPVPLERRLHGVLGLDAVGLAVDKFGLWGKMRRKKERAG
jgi:hypothetical protein